MAYERGSSALGSEEGVGGQDEYFVCHIDHTVRGQRERRT